MTYLMIEIASLYCHLYLLHQHSELGSWRLVLWWAGSLVERILLLCGWLLGWGLLRDYLLNDCGTDVVNTGQTSTLVVEETSSITNARTLQDNWSQCHDYNHHTTIPQHSLKTQQILSFHTIYWHHVIFSIYSHCCMVLWVMKPLFWEMGTVSSGMRHFPDHKTHFFWKILSELHLHLTVQTWLHTKSKENRSPSSPDELKHSFTDPFTMCSLANAVKMIIPKKDSFFNRRVPYLDKFSVNQRTKVKSEEICKGA